MKQTENYNLNLIENGDKILDSLSALNVNSTIIDINLKNKVEKEEGKGLSTNDYTTEEKEKLENTPIITNEDVQKWNNKSDFDGSYESLKDKPSIPTKTSELENDSGFAPVIISTTDLEDGVSELATGTIYIVYEE